MNPSHTATFGCASLGFALTMLASAASAQVVEDKLVDPLGTQLDRLGYAVAIDATQDLIVVGAPNDSVALPPVTGRGKALVYRRHGRGTWTLEQTLTNGGPELRDLYGHSVAVDGDVIVVGARYGDGLAQDTGLAYVYRYNPVIQQWTLEQRLNAFDGMPLDSFGFSVAVEGGVIVVGAPARDAVPPPGPVNDAGAAYVFEYDPVGLAWNYRSMLTAYDPMFDDWLGYRVAISGTWLAASAPVKATSQGAVYLATYRAGVLTPYIPALYASDGAAYDGFGEGLDIDQNVLVVGAPDEEPSLADTSHGAVYVFDFTTGAWAETQKVSASNAADEAFFGQSVSLRGDLLAVGAPGCDDPLVPARVCGSVYMFRDDGSGFVEERQRYTTTPGTGDKLGEAVATDGDVVVAGARTDDDTASDAGTAWVYRDAYGRNYGAGWAGTLGIPGLTLGADPVQGTNVPIVVGNSLGANTPAALLIGATAATLPTPLGGTLHLNPDVDLPFTLLAAGVTIPGLCPTGPNTSGLVFYLQVVEIDPGASHGLSFTPGLELGFGQF